MQNRLQEVSFSAKRMLIPNATKSWHSPWVLRIKELQQLKHKLLINHFFPCKRMGISNCSATKNIQTYRGLEVWGLKEPEEELIHKLWRWQWKNFRERQKKSSWNGKKDDPGRMARVIPEENDLYVGCKALTPHDTAQSQGQKKLVWFCDNLVKNQNKLWFSRVEAAMT